MIALAQCCSFNPVFRFSHYILCVVMLKNKLKELGLSRDVEIIRSRNPETLAKADIVMDVGGDKYDHHSSDNPAQENGVLMAAHETEEAAMNMAKEAIALASASTGIKNTNIF